MCLCVFTVLCYRCASSEQPRGGRYKQHCRQLTSALTQLAHPGKEPEIRLKATPGRAAGPVLRLPRLGDVALSPACGCSFRQRPAGDELAGAVKAYAANSSLAEPPRAPLAGSAHSSHRRCAPPGVGGPKSASVGGVPEPSCGCSDRYRPEQECGMSHLTLEENAPIVGHV